jgi:hypothetical protein
MCRLDLWRRRLRGFLQEETSRAALYSIANRGWSLASGLVIVVLIAYYTSRREQGYFYTYRSLLALQVIFELGLTTAISIFLSHEFAGLRWGADGEVEGPDPARTRCLEMFAQFTRWFQWAAIAFAVLVTPAGILFVGYSRTPTAWIWPWILGVIAAAGFLYLTPYASMVLAGGQVRDIYRVWLLGAVLGSCLAWVSLAAGFGLYAIGLQNVGNIAALLLFLVRHKPKLFAYAIQRRSGPGFFSWRLEMWPMQWRMSISWVAGYSSFYLFTPVIYHYHGAAAAGQIGMTITLAYAIFFASLSFINVKVPRMSALVASRQWKSLDREFVVATAVAVGFATAGALAAYVALRIVQGIGLRIGLRLVAADLALLLFLNAAAMVLINGLSTYLRMHKREPVTQCLVLGVLQGTAAVVLGGRYGSCGEIAGFFLITNAVGVPMFAWSWFRKRRALHAVGSGAEAVRQAEVGRGAAG